MLNPHEFAAAFARALDRFRDPGAKEEQKKEFRTVAAMLKHDGVTLAAQNGRVVVNGLGLGGGLFATLAQRLDFHAVGDITIPSDPPLQETFELLRALADQPGTVDVAMRLRANGVQRIKVTMQPSTVETPPVAEGEVAPAPPAPGSPAAPSPAATPPPRDSSGAASRSASVLVADLERSPEGPQVADQLAALGRQLDTAIRGKRLIQALDILSGIVRAEQQVKDATQRRQYSIALKRMYSKSVLQGIAELAAAPEHRDNALLALRRAGEDGVEVLLDLLVAAPTIDERRGIFIALTSIKEGTDQLVHMLGHNQWFVVRNVAELAGELGLEEAVPALAQQLDHADERVRKAVALALAKIGSRSAAEPLRRALRDRSREVRLQAALGVGGRRAGPLAMPLVVAMEEEQDETVEQELMLALGRIGSPAAVQALIKFAQPGGKLFGRKSSALRQTAVEALRLAATPAAVGTIEGLTADGDKSVREAALAALLDLKRK